MRRCVRPWGVGHAFYFRPPGIAPALQSGATDNRALILRPVRNGPAPANAAVVQQMVPENYVEHVPRVATGRPGLLAYLAERGPQPIWFGAQSTLDLFRLHGDLIVEHLDVIESLTGTPKDGNSSL